MYNDDSVRPRIRKTAVLYLYVQDVFQEASVYSGLLAFFELECDCRPVAEVSYRGRRGARCRMCPRTRIGFVEHATGRKQSLHDPLLLLRDEPPSMNGIF